MSLQIEKITIKYGHHLVLNDVSIKMEIGTVHGIAGVNGSGKTSILNAIAGFVKVSQGRILWNSDKVHSADVALLDSQPYFYKGMTGMDYISLFAARTPAFEINEWNDIFKLPLNERVDVYSSGMQKKLALMGAVALDRPLLLLDEPFNALDMEAVEWLKLLIHSLKEKGKTILLTSHIMDTLTLTCDCIHFIDAGNIKISYTRDHFEELKQEINQYTNETYAEKIRLALNNLK